MDILLWIIFGAVAGWLASIVMGNNAGQGWLMNIVLGIVGAFVGGFLMNLLGFGGVNGFNIYSLIVAILGAIVVTWLYGMFTRRAV